MSEYFEPGRVPDITGDEQLARKRSAMLEQVYGLLAELNGTNKATAAQLLFPDTSINIWNGTVDDAIYDIEKRGKKIEGLRAAISIARFYVEHDVDLPDEIIILGDTTLRHKDEESKDEKIKRETKKVLYYYTREAANKNATKLQFPASHKRALLGEEKKLISPDVFIANFTSYILRDDDLELSVDGVENILIGGNMRADSHSSSLQADLKAKNVVGILSGSNLGERYDRITIHAEGDIYQEEDSQNHARVMACDNYHFRGGKITLTKEIKESANARISITCHGEFIQEGGEDLLPNEVVINDKHLAERRASTQTRVFVGHHGMDVGGLPEGLQPAYEKSTRRDVVSLEEQREKFEKKYRDYISGETKVEHDGKITHVISYTLRAYSEGDMKAFGQFMADCVGTKWKIEIVPVHAAHIISVTISKEI